KTGRGEVDSRGAGRLRIRMGVRRLDSAGARSDHLPAEQPPPHALRGGQTTGTSNRKREHGSDVQELGRGPDEACWLSLEGTHRRAHPEIEVMGTERPVG